MEVRCQGCVFVCPVIVEFFWRNALLAIVEQLDMVHSFRIHSASSFVRQTAAFFGSCNVGIIVGPGLRGALRCDEGESEEEIAELHVD